VAATGDPAFGIKVASHIKQTTFHALSYGLSASSTLKEAFERVQRYCHVASDAIEYEFWRSGSEYYFVIEPRRRGRRRVGRRLGRRIPQDVPLPDRARLFASAHRVSPRTPHPNRRLPELAARPAANSAPRGPDWCSTETPSSDRWKAAIRSWRAIMTRSRFNTCRRSNVTTFSGGFARVLTQRLAHGEPSQDDVAELLNMRRRTLQRKLGAIAA